MIRKVFNQISSSEEEFPTNLTGYESLRLKNHSQALSWATKQKQTSYDLKIGEKLYQIPKSINEIRDLLINVLQIQENPNGIVEFNGTKYSCSVEQEGYLDRFLFFTQQSAIIM